LGLDFVIVKMWKSAAGQQLLESVAGGGLGASPHIFSTHARTNSSKACAWEKLDALRLFQAAKSFVAGHRQPLDKFRNSQKSLTW